MLDITYKFRDINFSFNLKIIKALKMIYGIGLQRSFYICAISGFSLNSFIYNINRYYFQFLMFFFKIFYCVDITLKRILINQKNLFLALKSYKSIKYLAGLPIKGQHTHNNAQTCKKKHYINKKK